MTKSSHTSSAAVKNIGDAIEDEGHWILRIYYARLRRSSRGIGECGEAIGSTVGRDQGLAVRREHTGSVHEARRDGSHRRRAQAAANEDIFGKQVGKRSSPRRRPL